MNTACVPLHATRMRRPPPEFHVAMDTGWSPVGAISSAAESAMSSQRTIVLAYGFTAHNRLLESNTSPLDGSGLKFVTCVRVFVSASYAAVCGAECALVASTNGR